MPTISAEALTGFAHALLTAGGFAEDSARQTASLLVWANLRGIESHGVLRIPRYIEMVKLGLVVPDSVPRTVRGKGAIAVLDGGRCAGAVGMNAAVKSAATLAATHGIGWCAARNISHCGALGYFTGALAGQGLIGIAMSASKPLMSYFGSRDAALSTNPISIAAPVAGGAPVILDMSTSAVALGKVTAAKDKGIEVPEGWGIDKDGNPTTDPAKIAVLLPMAGPKGSGLSLMIEVLASVLAGLPVIGPILGGSGSGSEPFNGLVIAADPEAFGSASDFQIAMTELSDGIHGLRSSTDAPILLPGERGARTAAIRQRDGIPISPGTAERLIKSATELAVDVPADLRT
ncbi:dehydrogenase [Oceanicola sp. 22II-s10i]|uniref:Ldh family oxidoreductase n=1 Tax=Oceanicola sp. 22II-s10i TaxID=1317116 RepID=UPI000B5209CC|nr:Ldh family oxidoreductase [Oceanicola sp. 22II-s10i]OWU83153.1 dehydrogenase [Oceanicola sp. 22II-s10i]